MAPDRPPVIDYRGPQFGAPFRPATWFDLHPDRVALALLAIAIGAFVAVHFTRNEPHEWAMCVLFSSLVWAPWGSLSSLIQLIGSPYGRKGEWLTALCIYVGVTVAMVAILNDHTLLGTLNYGSF